MKEKLMWLKFGAGVFLSVLALTACGGGGGGGSSVPDSYTGVTSQATITDANAETIVVGAWMGGTLGQDIGNITPTQAGSTSGTSMQGVLGLAGALKAPILQTKFGIQPAETLPPVDGSCGGQATVTISSQSSTSFSGQVLFENYCEDGTTLNGTVPFSGQLNQTLMLATQLKLTFSGLGVTEGSESVTLNNGFSQYTLKIQNNTPTGETDNLNYVLADNTSNKTYYVNNYIANITYGSTSDQATLTGRYYDYDYGYVNISTATALTIPDTATQPTGGALLFSGADKSQAQLIFNSDGTTDIEVDANGDGTYETTIPNPF